MYTLILAFILITVDVMSYRLYQLNKCRCRSFTGTDKVTKDETSRFFRRMSLLVGGTEIRCEEGTGSQNACT